MDLVFFDLFPFFSRGLRRELREGTGRAGEIGGKEAFVAVAAVSSLAARRA